MEYHVRLLPSAEADLLELHDWLLENAPLWGPRWFQGLRKTIASLREYPRRAPIAVELSSWCPEVEIRRILYGKRHHTYKIYFQILDDTIEILHVRHGARKPPTLWDVRR